MAVTHEQVDPVQQPGRRPRAPAPYRSRRTCRRPQRLCRVVPGTHRLWYEDRPHSQTAYRASTEYATHRAGSSAVHKAVPLTSASNSLDRYDLTQAETAIPVPSSASVCNSTAVRSEMIHVTGIARKD